MQSNFFTQYFICLLVLGVLPATAQTPFWTETFSDEATALANWTSGGENPGPENWVWSNDPGTARGAALNFAAPTATDGFMIFDSDANGRNEHVVTLTSPVIDCSGKDQVFLELFTQYIYYIYEFSQVEIGVSTDGTDFVYQDILTDVAAGYVYESAQRTVISLTDAINQPEVTIQIRWTGFFEYQLSIDDLSLYDTAPILANDLSISDIRHPSAYATPLSQVDSMFFLGLVNNDGADPQTNAQIRVTILDDNGDQVYQDSTEKVNMVAAGQDTLLAIENGFIPAAGGEYLAIETTTSDEDDEFFSNNREIFTFVITNNTFAVDDGDIQNVAAPSELSGDFWEGGNLYYVKNGMGMIADTARFMVWSEDETHIGQTISLFLYEIDEDDEAGFTDEDVNVAGFASYTLGPDDGNFELISAPIFEDGDGVAGVPLKDSTDYILMLALPEGIAIPYTYRDVIYDVGSVVKNGDDWFLGGFTGPLALIVRMNITEMQTSAAPEPELADSRINSFPNPATDFYRIDLDLENASPVQLQLMSMAGQIVLQKEYLSLQRDRIDLDVSDLPAGAYLVKVRTDEGVKTLKLTKQN